MDEEDTDGEMINEEFCIKCQSTVATSNLQEAKRGLDTLIRCAEKIKNNHLLQYLKQQQERQRSVKIHIQCQKDVYNELKRKGINVNKMVKRILCEDMLSKKHF